MINVPALVKMASISSLDLDVLRETYRASVPRSREEHQRIKRELAGTAEGTLLNTDALYSLKEAWNDDGTPAVAIAPIKTEKLHYSAWGTPRGGFHRFNETYHQHNFNSILTLPRGDGELRCVEVNVPFVPKALLPWNPLTRHKLHILFDSPVWRQTVPEDPYLLLKVSNNQFRVVAHWNLSDKEKLLMSMIR